MNVRLKFDYYRFDRAALIQRALNHQLRPNLGISNRNRKEIAACSFLFNSTLTVPVPCLIVGDSEKDQLVSLALIWPG